MNTRFFIFIFLLITFRAQSQPCTLKVNIVSSGTTICSGYSVTLTANASDGIGPYTYVWSTGETSPSISVNKEGTYTVSVSDKTPGCQPVTKSINILVSLTPRPPSAAGQTVCQGNVATLSATGPGGSYQWYDAPEGGNFLTSGNTYTTPPISSSTTFYVQTTVGGCTSPRTAVTVTVAAKPSVSGATVCVGSAATLSASGGDSYIWYDAPAGGNQVGTGPTFTIPALLKTTTFYVEGIVSGCLSGRLPVTARVGTPPKPPVATGTTICTGSVATLHAEVPSGIINWYDAPSGGTPLISSPDFTTPVLTATTTYYVQTTLGDCVSDRTPVAVTVNQIPAPPASQTVATCYGTSIILKASTAASANYQWFDAPEQGHLLATGLSYHTPALTRSMTYYVSSTNGNCSSSRSAVNVVVSPQPAAPSASGSVICFGNVTTLTATADPGAALAWYDAAAGGNLLAATASFTTPLLTSSKTYYVQATLAGCTSSRTAVPVTVLAPAEAPTASPATICAGERASLTASGAGDEYAWYDKASGGNLLSNAPTYVTPALQSSQTYYVQTSVNDCASLRTPVTVTVNPLPPAPTATGTSVCQGSPARLSANAPAGSSLSWYDAPSGGQLVATGPNFQIPALSSTATYYVQSTAGGCSSARVPVTANVNPADEIRFQYASGTFGTSGTDPKPTIRSSAGGVFTSAPSGLTFVDTATGEIDLSHTAPGRYTITITSNNPCGGTYSAVVTIGDHPDPHFSYNGPYCQDGINPLPFFSPGTSAGVFTASPSGLVFASVSSGEIDLSASKPGTYRVTNTIVIGNGAPPAIATAQVRIDERVRVSAGSGRTVPAGTPVSLTGSISGASGGEWKGGTGTFTDKTQLSTVYTPGAGERTAVLVLTSNEPGNACGAKSDRVTIHFQSPPAAPTASGQSVCLGNSAHLSATAPGGTYSWYDAPTGGTLLFTGGDYTTPPLTASTTYYVETKASGQTSARTKVAVMVNPIPEAPQVQGLSVCKGQQATLIASSPAGGKYRWYDAPAGGNLLSLKDTLVTTALNANTSYYVQVTTLGCASARTRADVQVNPLPSVTSVPQETICSGNALNYQMTADLPGTTFSWSRPAVEGISNPAVSGQTSANINETLIDTVSGPLDVTYLITPFAGNCPGPTFSYVVTVYPTPVLEGPAARTICNTTSTNYPITFNAQGTSFNWGRTAAAGILNAAVTGQAASTIRETLFNSTNAPVDVTYTFNYKTINCPGVPSQLIVTVNPTIKVTSDNKGVACSGSPQNYTIQANIPSATFSWRRAAVANISNPAVTDQTSSAINETLINTGKSPVNVTYIITPIAYGCQGDPFTYSVTVNPQPKTPVANSNSPVCLGSSILLRTALVQKASYLWTGPNGFTSTLQNPDINQVTAAAAGSYNLYVTVNGCTSAAGSTIVAVNQPPKADAGLDQLVCTTAPAVQLAGKVSGGTTTGIWKSSGTGTFLPANNDLNARYMPSAQDRKLSALTLTLSSTSKDDCVIDASDMTITFGLSPAADAGADRKVCSQDAAVPLEGKLLVAGGSHWSSSGNGTFSPSADQLDASYIPSAEDARRGSVILTLLATGADAVCYTPTDELQVTFIPPPSVNAGQIRYVLKDRIITLNPTVSDDNVQYLWSPNIAINDPKIKNPVITGQVDRTYTLQVTDSRGCVSQDKVFIKVSPELTVPNTFTPNSDGINDFWEIKGLVAYQDAVIDVFNRYGAKLYHSIGYAVPWDGTFNGQTLPPGTYYYVINTNVNNQVISGPVTILR
ncbi:PKD-like domain-containing protein [Mucilaginibacter sabulilitoris]|uniref:PKD-like domain-containing protein n=1 Tax=Mucilaginibacter sabulilitoris TaxID=1173583 RepID=A0ABZ0TUE9_9SPHI|nr:PKD-like domain-containing protein [Mucilaginibacter sabulilitoris]WPU95783.1 PKD-like domain-containing protein [Mucilaginibacter sabulilitoris]